MKRFAELFNLLDQTTSTKSKVTLLKDYFALVDDKDRMWAMALLSHRRPKRTIKTALLREWAAELSNLPLWLFEESYHIVGDLAETIALVLPAATHKKEEPLTYWIDLIKNLKDKEEVEKKEAILNAWSGLDAKERFIFNKLITGGFRVGVSQKLMTKALSQYTEIEEKSLTHRLMGNWSPDDTTFEELILNENPLDDISKPYPFYLAYAFDLTFEELGNVSEWQVERKWDGIRGQLIVRKENIFIWSRGEELVTDKFPEYKILTELLPDGTVIDGEILPFKDDKPLSFNILQTRIGRKNITKKILETAPVILMAYDLLELDGKDLRETPLYERRKLLEKLIAKVDHPVLKISPIVSGDSWSAFEKEREKSRSLDTEGLMLKRKESSYQSGRKKGDWWKWKVDPLTIDAVMLYAQRGHGRRSNLYTDYTFAVWDGDNLVPFTKAYSGLTDKEFAEVTKFVNKNTKEKFGPVRSVKAELVFEIAFEGISKSSRHKSGVALRFPRIKRWRKDKPVEEANTLKDLTDLLQNYQL